MAKRLLLCIGMALDLLAIFRGLQNVIKLERSSGFRPYLIFLAIVCSVGIALMFGFKDQPVITEFAIFIIKWSVLGFIVIYALKAFLDPNFCRSEKHIETVKKLEIVEQKGDAYPRIINPTTALEVKPEQPRITNGGNPQ